MNEELYKKHRPQKFGEIVGQDAAVRTLVDLGKRKAIPHTILFSGPSGCGKTTLARILRVKLRCGEMDFYEVNCADFRGIDMVRDIRDRIQLAPMGGESRIWLIDECARMTADAQNAFLKLLEDTPLHVYFFLATTDPRKLLGTIRTRATEIRVSPLGDGEMERLVRNVISKEGSEMPDAVVEKIVEVSGGSPRKALVWLNQVIGLDGEERQMSTVCAPDTDAEAIAVARALIKPRIGWSDMAKVLKDLKEDPEGVRRLVLGYMNTVVLGGGDAVERAVGIMEAFQDDLYSTGKAGLTLACYNAIHSANHS